MLYLYTCFDWLLVHVISLPAAQLCVFVIESTLLRGLGKPTAGLSVSLTWGPRHNFCRRGPILIPRPVLESPAQTTCAHVLDFFCET